MDLLIKKWVDGTPRIAQCLPCKGRAWVWSSRLPKGDAHSLGEAALLSGIVGAGTECVTSAQSSVCEHCSDRGVLWSGGQLPSEDAQESPSIQVLQMNTQLSECGPQWTHIQAWQSQGRKPLASHLKRYWRKALLPAWKIICSREIPKRAYCKRFCEWKGKYWDHCN